MRIVTADEAVAGIRSGAQVFVHGGAATPSALLEALVRRADELRDVGVIHFHLRGPRHTWRRSWPPASVTGRSSSVPMPVRP